MASLLIILYDVMCSRKRNIPQYYMLFCIMVSYFSILCYVMLCYVILFIVDSIIAYDAVV